jgi:hypothetical protein
MKAMQRPSVGPDEKITKVVDRADGLVDVHTKCGGSTFVYEGVARSPDEPLEVDLPLLRAPECLGRSQRIEWSPWGGELVDD